MVRSDTPCCLPARTYKPLPLSAATLALIEQSARELAGPYTPRELADAAAELSRVYTRSRGEIAREDASRTALLARLGFFFARDLPKVFGPLDELAACGLLPARKTLRVLDVGAGFGATSFGVARWLRAKNIACEQLEVVALEQRTRALAAFRTLTNRLHAQRAEEFVPLVLDARAVDLRDARLTQRFDLVLFGFVLNELFTELSPAERAQRRAELLLEAAHKLDEGGGIVVLEPASKESARELMQVRDLLVARAEAPFVIAPCLHRHGCPMLPSERDWCHQELAYALPRPLAEIARMASLRYEGLRYASLVLANRSRASEPGAYRVVSERLESKGKLELYGCGEPGYVRLTRLNRAASAANAGFGEAQRGDILYVEGDSARVDADSTVRRVPLS